MPSDSGETVNERKFIKESMAMYPIPALPVHILSKPAPTFRKSEESKPYGIKDMRNIQNSCQDSEMEKTTQVFTARFDRPRDDQNRPPNPSPCGSPSSVSAPLALHL